tara:strand:+ start:500 stop:1003 length:504 start_codon:yes stop_codon:yes gene_type:complete
MKTKLLTICLLFAIPSLCFVQMSKADSYMERPMMPSDISKKNNWSKFGKSPNLNDAVLYFYPKRIKKNKVGNYLVWVLHNHFKTERSNLYLYEIDCEKNMRFRKIYWVNHDTLWAQSLLARVYDFDKVYKGFNKDHWEKNMLGLESLREDDRYFKNMSNLYSKVCNK